PASVRRTVINRKFPSGLALRNVTKKQRCEIARPAQEPFMNSKVEKRHKLFAQEYVIDFNGRRAAIAAGYGETRAEVTASELLKVPRRMALIEHLQSHRASNSLLKNPVPLQL